MTHRFDLKQSGDQATILFQGRLDRAALAELRAQCRAQQQRGQQVRVRLGAGSEVRGELLEELLQLDGVAVEAESAFLALWIQRCQQEARPPEEEQS